MARRRAARKESTNESKQLTVRFTKKQWTAYKLACLLKKVSPKKQLKTLATNWADSKLKGVL
jgi:BarA-like signal transduction histidine kinase